MINKTFNIKSFHNIEISQQNLLCIYLNIRSLRTNFLTFNAYIDKLLENIDVIILVETNITDHEISLFQIKDFEMISLNRNTKRGGGVAVYVKTKWNITSSKTHFGTLEAISLDIENKKKRFTF